jgi:hypothetical protein
MSQALTLAEAKLPTYRTAAAVLEGTTGSGLKLAGWTLLRTMLIGPPMLLVGVPAKKAFLGALIASGLISSLTLLRIFSNGPMSAEMAGPKFKAMGLGDVYATTTKRGSARGSARSRRTRSRR